jgi:predicted dehydrogenase
MDKVRIGVIGVGGMGTHHAKYIQAGEINRLELAAICDTNPKRLEQFADIPKFTNSSELIRSGLVDAVLIATPHYEHTPISIDALQNGLHVLVEKPIAVHKADAQRMIDAHKGTGLVFQAMFQMRTEPLYKKIKQLISNGELGEFTRMTWIVTDWFRTEAYYASGEWRATWKGEGGGVLLNQCPHNLDLMQWLLPMPAKVRAFCKFGRWHNIEVEDEVTAYFEYPNGATGVFITSTGEAPGTNRLEISGERGKLTIENGKIRFIRNEVPMSEFSRTSTGAFSRPEHWYIDVPTGGGPSGHKVITQNFVDAILDGAELISPAPEGINSVELANAMLYSSLTDSTVELPLDASAYEAMLQDLCAKSKYQKKVVREASDDINASWHR